MPRTRVQGVIFGLIMSYAMAYGMEVFNVAIKMGYTADLSAMRNIVFLEALKEASFMGLFVFLFSNLWGNRFGAYFERKHCDSAKDNPYFCRLMHQAGAVAVMCPTMSLVASILFSVILGGDSPVQLPAIWIGTLIKNFPIAFLLNMFAAAPFSRWLFQRLFPEKQRAAAK